MKPITKSTRYMLVAFDRFQVGQSRRGKIIVKNAKSDVGFIAKMNELGFDKYVFQIQFNGLAITIGKYEEDHRMNELNALLANRIKSAADIFEILNFMKSNSHLKFFNGDQAMYYSEYDRFINKMRG